jgi:hypothetical protein
MYQIFSFYKKQK